MDGKRRAPLEHLSADTVLALARFASAWWLPWLCSVVWLVLMAREPATSSWKYTYGFGCLAFSACTLVSLHLREILASRDGPGPRGGG